ncbi:MAG TPA: polyphosphate kinase 1 [Gemmatimonadaceae bacterium]|nr:polyphosphate kinase 1 [Gemmatimonadaceae bacterium]
MKVVRYELRSASELDTLARAPLPLGIYAGVARGSSHRDLYLDTEDDALRSRGVVCRLRIGGRSPHRLTLVLGGDENAERVEVTVRATNAAEALAADTAVRRRLLSIADPSALVVRVALEVDRLTRAANPDLLMRRRVEMHFDRITIRRDGETRTLFQLCVHHRRGSVSEFQRLVDALEREHDLVGAEGDRRGLAELLLRWMRPTPESAAFQSSDHESPFVTDDGAVPEMLSPELSLLAFQRRVLALAEDPETPLRERLRFLGIVTSNVDEIYMVRMPELRQAAAKRTNGARSRGMDGLTAGDRLERVEREIASIVDAHARCAAECLHAAEVLGTRILRWNDLSPEEQAELRARCRDEIYPELTPLAMTLSPGHPLPHLPHLGLSLAVVFRRSAGSEAHLAELELPRDAERLLSVRGRRLAVIPIEEVLRANVDLLYPNAHVDGAYLFRVTRAGDLELDERSADDLLDAVSEATERRPYNAAVRVEVQRSMPHTVAELVLENLRREAAGRAESALAGEVHVVNGMLDLRCLGDLPLPDDPALVYPSLPVCSSIDAARPVIDQIADGDLLVHHPFDDYESTVVRFLREAAADPAVTTIKITLYRAGDPSAVVDALLAAARAGKKVAALVELKARFDEEHNVGWARALETAGAHVVYGFVGLKVHAKLALVVRREGASLRRYAHVGTGNYNTRSGRQYTDLSLFSASEALTSDAADLFNALTGSSRPPEGLAHGTLVAPVQLLPSVLELIEREARHARTGQPSGIRIKVNGLSDAEVVRALYRASEAGVRVELVVRGICTVRPDIAGRSDTIRVVSVVGRFLEHSRIYRFESAGTPEYFIGSSDLRPRNLRRRVELLVPVHGTTHRDQLDHVLDLYLQDRTAWALRADGRYVRSAGGGPSAQSTLAGQETLTPLASRTVAPTG